jgi:putative proteasome-type protease
MTYCVAISVDAGLVFASDSRTNAGADQAATYGKLYTFGCPGDRQMAIVAAGSLATTQAAMVQLHDDIKQQAPTNMMNVASMSDAADYLGRVSIAAAEKHGAQVREAGFSVDATFILGGQIGEAETKCLMVYPQGNWIETTPQTPFHQIGETKYGKPILERVIRADTDLDECARCALVSMDSTMRSNATVGPPVEVICLPAGALAFSGYLNLKADDPYWMSVHKTWDEKVREAFQQMPCFEWGPFPGGDRFQ